MRHGETQEEENAHEKESISSFLTEEGGRSQKKGDP